MTRLAVGFTSVLQLAAFLDATCNIGAGQSSPRVVRAHLK
jgi:hypothetical protein